MRFVSEASNLSLFTVPQFSINAILTGPLCSSDTDTLVFTVPIKSFSSVLPALLYTLTNKFFLVSFRIFLAVLKSYKSLYLIGAEVSGSLL